MKQRKFPCVKTDFIATELFENEINVSVEGINGTMCDVDLSTNC